MALPNRGGVRPGGGGFNRGRFAPRKEAEHRINHHIRVPQVRLVGDNVTVGVYPTQEALKMAQEQELDLVEISPQADPPVCKIIDYNKFLYDKKKKEKEMKAKAKTTEMKEIRFTPNTDDHDFDFKSKHAENFLKDGNKVKAYVQFKGRAIQFKDRGELLLLKFAERLKDSGQLESMPKLEGKRMLAIFTPKASKKPKEQKESREPKEPREPRPPKEPKVQQETIASQKTIASQESGKSNQES